MPLWDVTVQMIIEAQDEEGVEEAIREVSEAALEIKKWVDWQLIDLAEIKDQPEEVS